MVIDFGKKEFDFKRVMQIILSTVALVLVIFIAIWIMDYFLVEFPNIILQNLRNFLNDSGIFCRVCVVETNLGLFVWIYYKNKILRCKSFN